jgi:hypothetical protein
LYISAAASSVVLSFTHELCYTAEITYATFNTSESYLFLQQHKDDPNAKNSPEAQQKGYTQEPFDRNLVPDALRGDFCIPNQGTQESGKAVTSKLPPGCSN